MLLDCLHDESIPFQHILHNHRKVLPFCVLAWFAFRQLASTCFALQAVLSRRSKVSQDDLPLLACLQVSKTFSPQTQPSLRILNMQCSSRSCSAVSHLSFKLQGSCPQLAPIRTCTKHSLPLLQDIQLQSDAAKAALPGSNILSDVLRVIQYLPQALMYIAHNCPHLKELSLELLGQSAANSSRGNSVWDHPSLLKRPHFRLSEVWSHCTSLHSLTLVNIPSR